MSGDHMGDNDDLEKYLKDKKLENVNWHFVKPGSIAHNLNVLNRKGILTYSFYFAYRFWHKNVYDYCQTKLKINNFDVIHYLSPIGYREPGYLWKLDRPYIWGPFGGATSIDLRLLEVLPNFGKAKLLFRKTANWLQLRCSPRLKHAFKAADSLLTATTENRDIFKKLHNVNTIYLPENGTIGKYQGELRSIKDKSRYNLIWIGSIDERKALKLLVDAFQYVERPELFNVHVLGKGPLQDTLMNSIRERKLESVFIWHGHLSREKVLETLRHADLHVITSVSEGNPTTIWESLQNGVPTLSLDHCGMHDTITKDSGIKIPIAGYSEVVRNFGDKLNEIANDPSILEDISKGVESSFNLHHWNHRVEFFERIYEQAISDFNKKHNQH